LKFYLKQLLRPARKWLVKYGFRKLTTITRTYGLKKKFDLKESGLFFMISVRQVINIAGQKWY